MNLASEHFQEAFADSRLAVRSRISNAIVRDSEGKEAIAPPPEFDTYDTCWTFEWKSVFEDVSECFNREQSDGNGNLSRDAYREDINSDRDFCTIDSHVVHDLANDLFK